MEKNGQAKGEERVEEREKLRGCLLELLRHSPRPAIVSNYPAGRAMISAEKRTIAIEDHCNRSTHHGVPITYQIPQSLDEPVFYTQLGFQVEHLRHAQSRSFAHVWVLILQTTRQRGCEVVEDLFGAEDRHRSDGECPDEGIWVGRVLPVSNGLCPVVAFRLCVRYGREQGDSGDKKSR